MYTFTTKIRDLLSYVPWVPRLLYYHAADPCIDAGASAVVPYFVVINCYDSFPLLNSMEKDVLETLAVASDLDVKARNIKHTLNTIKAKNHITEHGFQKDLTIAYNQMFDVNYKYTSQCFSTFEFVHPFPLELVNDDIQIAANFVHHPRLVKEWATMGIKVQKYTGSKVLQINGIPALDFLASYAQTHVGSTPDPQARLSLTLARAKFEHGNWTMDEGAFSRTRIAPEKPYLHLKIESRKLIFLLKAPFLSISSGNFDSRTSFYYRNCLSSRPLSSKYNPTFWLPKNRILFWKNQVSIHEHEKAGIMKIEKFNLESPELQLKEIVSGLKWIKDHNMTSLILDLSDTTGDGVCVTQYLMKTLFNKDIGLWFQFRHTPIFDSLTNNVRNNSFLNITFVFNERYFTPNTFLKTKFHMLKSKKISYTPPLQEACPLEVKFISDLIPKKISVMTNGICFGACALFVAELSSHDEVSIFKVGGMKEDPVLLVSSSVYDKTSLTQITAEVGSLETTLKDCGINPFTSVAQLYLPTREFIHGKGRAAIRSQRLISHHIMHRPRSLPFDAWEEISNHTN